MPDKAWYRENPAVLEAAVQDALAVQPQMRLDDDGEVLVFRGRFEIRDGGRLIEAFAIDIELSPVSPRDLPRVWETAGRIPRVRDPHHVNEGGDETLCVLLPDAYWYYHPQGLTLGEFLEGPLREHLAGQALVLRGGDWPADEWSHGTDGAVEFYREVLEVKDDTVLFRLMASELSRRSKRQMRCQCGSGKLRRHCHSAVLRRLRKGPHFIDVCYAVRPTAQVK